jgi:hypothetical protein
MHGAFIQGAFIRGMTNDAENKIRVGVAGYVGCSDDYDLRGASPCANATTAATA